MLLSNVVTKMKEGKKSKIHFFSSKSRSASCNRFVIFCSVTMSDKWSNSRSIGAQSEIPQVLKIEVHKVEYFESSLFIIFNGLKSLIFAILLALFNLL